MQELGKFYSWEILNKNVALKQCDKSLFEYAESGIPIQIRNFFEISSLSQGEALKIELVFDNQVYEGVLLSTNDGNIGRTKIRWGNDLKDKFREQLRDVVQFPLLKFEKVNSKKYNIAIIYLNEEVINRDIENNLETVVIKNNLDGNKKLIYTTKYERNIQNRLNAIKIHGVTCQICGFNFEEKYGEYGKDYIEVHHIKPLHTLEEEMVINPETDLICVCANCHRMIHRNKNEVLSVEEIKKIIKR
ncbi:HNH endonuclease [[Clostridium] innocuum]|uniref:HNH endonuclease n=1 Tax=Clostridium innocuum TaxID=1522 RepID=UPI000C2FD5C5|nr:HNH endonuclease [[Clostridium] innocuum]MCR0176101.1 HNH endonuclease [[Clostridium] innocuum]MCR0642917.1 HNH endonuclease [[Clostridium] innocuum]